MANPDNRDGARRSATPILTSEAATDIKKRMQDAWSRDVRVMVRERSAYRRMWPLVLILLTLVNVYLAGGYLARMSEPGGEALWLGMTANQWMNWTIAALLIVSGRCLIILASDATATGFERVAMGAVIVGLIGFSVWTGYAESATKLQKLVDRGSAVSAQVEAAGATVALAGQALQGAQADLDALRVDLASLQGRAQDARAAWAAYQADAKARYSGNDLAWVLNATHARGPAKPYLAAIDAADAEVAAARGRIEQAQAAVASARADAVQSQRDAAQAAAAPGSERTVLETFGAWVPAILGGPWSANTVVGVWALVVSILLECAGYVGALATGRILRESLSRTTETRGAAADAIRRDAAQAASGAAQGAPARSQAVNAAQAPAAFTGPFAGLSAWQGVPHSVGAVSPLSGEPEGEAGDAASEAAARLRHAEKIADAVADAEQGLLDDASFPALRRQYGVGQVVAGLIRNELVNRGLFVAAPGGGLVRA